LTSVLVAFVMLTGCASTSPTQPPSSSATRSVDASIAATPTPSLTPAAEPNDVDRLLASASEHLGAEVEITGDVCDVAEGGPLLFLADGAGECRIIVLIDTRLSSDGARGDWIENRRATVIGTFGELTAENVDSIESESLEGEGFVAFWEPEGYRYLVIATRITQGSNAWPADY
jgi:hypothetical protein